MSISSISAVSGNITPATQPSNSIQSNNQSQSSQSSSQSNGTDFTQLLAQLLEGSKKHHHHQQILSDSGSASAQSSSASGCTDASSSPIGSTVDIKALAKRGATDGI